MVALNNKRGWVIVFASFLVQSLTHGLASSLGIFYVKWKDEFPNNSAEISSLASSVLAIILCTSPFSGAAVRCFGVRPVVVVGSIISCTGWFLSSMAQEVRVLFLTISFMVGVGSSLCYMASIISVSQHFQKNFVTASGIANIGASMGIITLTVLFERMTTLYGWRRTVIIVAVIQSLTLVCGLLMRPPKEEKIVPKSVQSDIKRSSDGDQAGITVTKQEGILWHNENKFHSRGKEDVEVYQTGSCDDKNALSSDIPVTDDDSTPFFQKEDLSRGGDLSSGNDVVQNSKKENLLRDVELERECQLIAERDFVGDDSFTHIETSTSISNPIFFCLHSGLSSFFHSALHLINIPLLWTNLPYTSFNVTCGIGGTILGTVFPLIKAKGISHGIESFHASLFIVMIGVGNIISRTTYGRLVDKGLIHPSVLFSCSYALASVSCLVMALSSSFVPLLLGTLTEGIAAGVYISLPIPLIRGLVGKENLAGAFGLNLFCVGSCILMSATLSGYLLDATGNYTIAFLFPTCTAVIAFAISITAHIYWGVYKKDPRWPKKFTPHKPEEFPQHEESGTVTAV